jgi:transcriptional regulator with XRE-family HTH domain
MSRAILRISTDIFRRALKNLRQRIGITQDELARRIGSSVSTVSQWEQGRRANKEGPQGDLLITLMRQCPTPDILLSFLCDLGIESACSETLKENAERKCINNDGP